MKWNISVDYPLPTYNNITMKSQLTQKKGRKKSFSIITIIIIISISIVIINIITAALIPHE